MGVDGLRGGHLAGGVHDGDLHARTETGVQTHRGAGTGGRRQQQIAQVRREDPYRLVLGGLPQPQPQIDPQVHLDPGAPGPADGVLQPLVGRTAPVRDAEAVRDGLLVRSRPLGGRRRVLGLQVEVEDLFLLAAEHRQHPVGGEFGERLGEVEVVGELRACSPPCPRGPSPPPARATTSVRAAHRSDPRPRRTARSGWPARPPGRRPHRRPPCRRPRTPRPPRPVPPTDRSAARRRAAPGPPPARSVPWCAAWACTGGRCPPAAPWSRRRGSAPPGRRPACPGTVRTPGSRSAAPPAPADSAAAPPTSAAAHRRASRWLPCGSAR